MSEADLRTRLFYPLVLALAASTTHAQEARPDYPLPLSCESPAKVSEIREPAPAGPGAAEVIPALAEVAERIARLSAAQGPLWAGLASLHEEAGLALQREGRHAEAIAAFEDAMHIRRVNGGLFTLEQLSALDAMIGSRAARGEYAEVDSLQEYVYYLHRKNYSGGEPAFLAAVEKYADWHVNAWTMDLDRQEEGGVRPWAARVTLHPRLEAAEDMYEFLLTVHDLSSPADIGFRQRIVHKIATLYYLSRLRFEDEPGPVGTGSTARRTPAQEYLSPVIVKGYLNMAETLEDIVRRLEAANAGAREIVAAWLNLGDWHLAFDRPQRAAAAYGEAWTLAAHDGAGAAARALLNEDPALRIPGFVSSLAPFGLAGPASPPAESALRIRMAKDRYGNPRNLSVVESPAQASALQKNRLLEELRRSKYRPRITAEGTIEQEEIEIVCYLPS